MRKHTHTHTQTDVTFARQVTWLRSRLLRRLTGGQVEHDAHRGRVVDDVRPLVQVVNVIAAVVATVTEHQLQHQVL